MARLSVIASLAVTLLLVGYAAAADVDKLSGLKHISAVQLKHIKDVTMSLKKFHASGKKFGAQQTVVLESDGDDAACFQKWITAMAKVNVACGNTDNFDQLLNASAPTSYITQACSTNCQAELKTARATLGSCMSADDSAGYDMVTSLCIVEDGQTCADRMRTYTALSDCSDITSSIRCRNNTKCQWKPSNYVSTCEPILSTGTLQQICTSCLDRLVLILGRQEGADYAALVIASKNVMCLKSGDSYCAPMFDALDSRITDFGSYNTMPADQIAANVTAICSNSVQKKCIQMAGVASAAVIRGAADTQYKSCVRYSYYWSSSCQSNWWSYESSAVQVEQTMQFLCSTNDEGSLCVPAIQTFFQQPCVKSLYYTCNSTCAAAVMNLVNSSRCCIRRYTDLQNARPDYARLPPVSGISKPTTPTFYADTTFSSYISTCSLQTANVAGYNYTQLLATANTSCAGVTVTLQRKEIALRGIVWSQVNGTLKVSIEAACRADIATRLGVLAAVIVNGSLQEDSSQRLALPTYYSRRQSTNYTTSSGAKYVFSVGGSNNADVTANTAAFDAAQSSNSIQLPATATVILGSCSTCVASPVAPPGQTPAPISTANLFAAMTGGDTSGTTPPTPTSSSASSVAVAAAAVAAVALVMAL